MERPRVLPERSVRALHVRAVDGAIGREARLTAFAKRAVKHPRAPSPPAESRLSGFSGDALSALNAMLYGDRLPESLLEALLLQTKPAKAKQSASVPPHLAPVHHLALSLEDRARTAREPSERFARRYHPTWSLGDGASGVPVSLGGARTKASVIPIARIADLAALVPGTSVRALELELPTDVLLDFACAYVFHDEQDATREVRYEDGRAQGQRWDRALLPLRAQVLPTPQRFTAQTWASSNRRENLNRFFGTPTFVQSPAYPKCPTCRQRMPLLMQMELGLPCADGGELDDSGVPYAFLCAACRVTAWTRQSTSSPRGTCHTRARRAVRPARVDRASG